MSYPDDNPKTKFGLSKAPVHLVPPALIHGAAEAWANGAEKYGPFNWREHKISSTVYYAACLRHLMDWYDRVDIDDCAPDSKVHHLKHAAACIGMLLDTLGSDKLNDNRPVRSPALRPKAQPERVPERVTDHADWCTTRVLSNAFGACNCHYAEDMAPSAPEAHHGKVDR